ncbi:tetratricopeptide repeat (TPR)-like superfamily protein [Actinidia rufa]|uniref:Tetratricopeptide repeat (TPR)-like superfamily protein n=1 Tax=Actinidia rufa TaxID=165716 RepID=A0A7J0H253_9ERIC|nr:tetratricopeptide repeat (TPR)-like superfamily protein [Actinidia rufa]
MKATLLRIRSFPVRHHSFVFDSPIASLSGSSIAENLAAFECRSPVEFHCGEGLPGEAYESESEGDDGVGGIGSLILNEVGIDRRKYAGDLPDSGIPVEEQGFPGVDDRNDDRSKIRAYYEEMLKSNPTNSLLLRNYGSFLHEVERDAVKAEEYYGRAILASPGDGEVLSLYGKLIWETQRDEDRANSYFEQAVRASPNDSYGVGIVRPLHVGGGRRRG